MGESIVLDKHEVVIDREDWEEYQIMVKFFHAFPKIKKAYNDFYKESE